MAWSPRAHGRPILAVVFAAAFLPSAKELRGRHIAPALVRADESAMVHIRARSQLRLRESERERHKDRYRLGLLIKLDDNAKDESATRSFAGQRVRLELSNAEGVRSSALVFTDASGVASHRFFGLVAGRYHLLAHYAGDDERDPSEASLDVDLDLFPAELEIEVPPSIGLFDALPVRITLQSAGPPLARQVELLVGKSYAKTLSLEAAAKASVRQTIRLSPPPPPGTQISVVARFAGDEETAPVESRREVELTTQARMTLEVESPHVAWNSPETSTGGATPEVPQGSRLILTGTVFDETGPLVAETVELEVTSNGERRWLGSALSDRYGRYRLEIDKLRLRTGAAILVAQVTPRRHYILPGRTAEMPLTVLPAEPVSLRYFLLPLLLSVLGLGAHRAGRFLRPLLDAWRVRLFSAQRRGKSEAERKNGGPGGREAVVTSAPSGRFPLGEPRGLAGRSLPLRERLYAEWQQVAMLYYSDEAQRLTRTPRELLLDVFAHRLPHAEKADLERLQRLTNLVEQGYYSQRSCTPDMLSEAAGLAAALLQSGAGARTGESKGAGTVAGTSFRASVKPESRAGT